MSVYIAPGVYVQEVDLSLYVPNLSTTSLGCVGYAAKGPINTPTFISDAVQFTNTFGSPNVTESLYGPYAALQYLNQGRQLWYTRVAGTDDNGASLATESSVVLNEKVSAPYITSAAASRVTLTSSTNELVFWFNDVTKASTDYHKVTVTITVPGTSRTFTMQEIAGNLNSNSTFAFWATASVAVNGTLTITHKTPGSASSIICDTGVLTDGVVDDGFGFTSSAVYGTGTAYSAPVLVSKNFVDGIFTFTTGTGGLGITYGFAPADGAALTVVAGAGSARTATISGASFPADFAAHTGVVTKIKVKVSSTYYSVVANVSNGTLSFTSADIVAGTYTDFYFVYEVTTADQTITKDVTTLDTYVQLLRADSIFANNFYVSTPTATGATQLFVTPTRHNGAKSFIYLATDSSALFNNEVFTAASYVDASNVGTTPIDLLTVSAVSPGTWGNSLAVRVVYQSGAASNLFDLYVYDGGQLVEKYLSLNRDTPLIAGDVQGTPVANPKYVETAINGVSSRITVSDNQKNVPAYVTYVPAESPSAGVALVGGSNGLVSDVSPYIGTVSGTVATGLELFSNPEAYDINILAVPGVSDAAVIDKMISICEARTDCVALVDPPRNTVANTSLTPQEVVDWHNGSGIYADHQAFNSSYAVLYWPWLQIYDPINKTLLWTPPSGHVAAAYAYNDYSGEPWFAPAGLNRGHLVSPKQADYIPTTGEIDLMYGNGNAVNPIVTFKQNGINIWGQRTLQRKPSALDRVNVRRLLIYLEKVIATASRYLLFQPNDASTWIEFTDMVTPLLGGVQSRRGLEDFQVRCDATTNTSDVIDRNEMHAVIFLKPTKSIEVIQLQMVITSSGASFNELVF